MITYSIELHISLKLYFFDMLTWEHIFLEVINIYTYRLWVVWDQLRA